MGDAADKALDDIMDVDELWERGEIIYEPEDGLVLMHPFTRFRVKPSGPGTCPKCGGKTVLISGCNGPFYGCCQYPECSGSRDFE